MFWSSINVFQGFLYGQKQSVTYHRDILNKEGGEKRKKGRGKYPSSWMGESSSRRVGTTFSPFCLLLRKGGEKEETGKAVTSFLNKRER